jgi:hypothetical protein
VVNFKWGLFSAVSALIISIGLGLISEVQVLHIILRGIIFSIVFFGVGFGLRFLLENYFPELLFSDDGNERLDDHDEAVHAVSITLDSKGEYAVPELFKPTGDTLELGNIEDLLSGFFKPQQEGIDRNGEEGYNKNGGLQTASFQFSDQFQEGAVFEKPQEKKPVFTPSFGDNSDGLGGLPDLDAMAMAFSPRGDERTSTNSVEKAPASNMSFMDSMPLGFGGDGFQDESIAPPVASEPASVRSSYVGNKPQTLKGDFNPKELAEGLRTVLSKDK